MLRQLIEALSEIPHTSELQIAVCEDCIEWCKVEKRTFLRHRIEIRLAVLYLDFGKFSNALDVISELHKEVKKLDDKLLLVEILVVESKINIALKNIPKAKVSLTAAKANANAIHCPYLLQSEIDMISGIVNAQELDFKTAYSYFNEAFESLHQNREKTRATKALRYMLLSKIMNEQPKEVDAIVNSKIVAMDYASKNTTEPFVAISKAQSSRSVEIFEATVNKYTEFISSDPVISHHIRHLNERLIEQNILRIIEPYSRVEISHVAKIIKLPIERVQAKLGDMILDEKLNGTLDQGVGVLILFTDRDTLGTFYQDIIDTIENTSKCVDALFEKSKKLTA